MRKERPFGITYKHAKASREEVEALDKAGR